MANTTIAIKKSATAAAIPNVLQFGELAINYADGKLFYKNVNSSIVEFSPTASSFGTVNANNILVVSDTAGDILTILPGTNINIVGDAVNDRITVGLQNDLSVTTVSATGNISAANLSTTGQIVSTKTNSTVTGEGQLYLNGSTGNRLDFNTEGTGAPAFTTRSVGTKIVLYPTLGASQADYALGINAGTLWSSIPGNDAGQFFKWYGGTTQVASLSGTGEFTVGTVNATSILINGSPVALALVANLAFDKANSANVLAFNTGVGANAFASATIAGANTAVGTGANAYAAIVGTSANAYATLVGTGANAFTSATIAGANTAVGAGANAYAAVVGTSANAFASATIAGANTAVGAGANAYATLVGTSANAVGSAAFAKANNAEIVAIAAFAQANTAAGGGTSVDTSDTAPGAPTDGTLWWNSTLGKMFIYYNDGTSSQWVESSPALAQPERNYDYAIAYALKSISF